MIPMQFQIQKMFCKRAVTFFIENGTKSIKILDQLGEANSKINEVALKKDTILNSAAIGF